MQSPRASTVTCELTGGLGNQLFIVFATLAYAFEHDLRFAFPCFRGTKGVDGSARPAYWDTLFRALAPFVKATDANDAEPSGPVQRIRERDAFTYTPPPPPVATHGTICMQGYFQHPAYTARHWAHLVATLDLAPLQTESHDAISLHFRLGDYDLLRHLYPSMTTEYYARGLAHVVHVTGRDDWAVHYAMQEVSDDRVEATLVALHAEFPRLTFVRIPPTKADWEQFLHLSCCRHNVIANSTFSWWAARLNRHADAVVVYPSRWRVKERLCTPEHWTECAL